jgi:hypothetical protein
MSGGRVVVVGLSCLFLGSAVAVAVATPPKLPFGPGERFDYDLSALGASAGKLKIGVIDQGQYNGKTLMSLAAKLEPAGLVKVFWEGESRRTAFLDTGSLTPLRVIDVEENRDQIWKTQIDFDGIGGAVITRIGANKKDGSDIVSKRAIPLGALDALSGLYKLRSKAIAVGDAIVLDLLDDGRLYQIDIKADRREKVHTVLGDREAFVLVLEGRKVAPKPARPKGKIPEAAV